MESSQVAWCVEYDSWDCQCTMMVLDKQEMFVSPHEIMIHQ